MSVALGGGNGFGYLTATAGTVINCLLPPRVGYNTHLTKLVYTAAATAHLITAMRSITQYQSTTLNANLQSWVPLLSAAAKSQAVVPLSAQPGTTAHPIAANDWCAITEVDGVTRFYQVTSAATLATVTLTANLVAGAAINAPFWLFGTTTTVDPWNGLAHQQFQAIASVTTTYDQDGGDMLGLLATYLTQSPILLQSNNATNAGFLQQASFNHTQST